MNTSEHFRAYLRENGLVFTAARRAILDGIVASSGHFDADILHEGLKKRGVSAATIYRTLPLFVQSGIITETLRERGRARYECAWGHAHHDHLECVLCGRVIEFKHDGLEKLQDAVCRSRGFTPIDHHLGIRGYCSACRKKKG
jgi:Fur family transcriptional regulator, ferric uptake regulator